MPVIERSYNSEADRMDLAIPEIDKLNELEGEVVKSLREGYITTNLSPEKLTSSQLAGLFAERRRIIELRSKLTGAFPIPQENGGDDYDR